MTDPIAAASTPRAVLIAWPEEAARREALAAAGVPRLLVIADRAPVPPVLAGEDWIRASSDERDAANRLDRLMPSRSLDGAIEPRLLAGPLPSDLSDDEYRVARILLASEGRLVRHADLPVEDLDAVVTSLAPVLGALGLAIRAVGTVGLLVEADPPGKP